MKMCSQIKAARGWYKQQEKGTRVMLTILTAAVTFYLVFLLWLLPEMMETVPMDTKYWTVKILAALLMTVPVYLGLQWCVYRLSGAELKESGAGTDSIPDENAGENRDAAEKKEKMRRRFWFLLGFSLVFAWLMVYFYAYFPGSFDWDNLDQWWQIQNSQYDTWHPVFHTLIIAPVYKGCKSLRLCGVYAAAAVQPALRISLYVYLFMAFSGVGNAACGVLPGGESADAPDSALHVEGQRADTFHAAVYGVSDPCMEERREMAEEEAEPCGVDSGVDFHFSGPA